MLKTVNDILDELYGILPIQSNSFFLILIHLHMNVSLAIVLTSIRSISFDHYGRHHYAAIDCKNIMDANHCK